jgi:hypothetical protein
MPTFSNGAFLLSPAVGQRLRPQMLGLFAVAIGVAGLAAGINAVA